MFVFRGCVETISANLAIVVSIINQCSASVLTDVKATQR